MLWASGGGGGGYPGVTSDSNLGLVLQGRFKAPWIEVLDGGELLVRDATGNSLFVVVAGHFNDGGAFRNGVGLFGHLPPSSATTGGAHTAGGTYTAVEQAMLEACYTALQSIGLVT